MTKDANISLGKRPSDGRSLEGEGHPALKGAVTQFTNRGVQRTEPQIVLVGGNERVEEVGLGQADADKGVRRGRGVYQDRGHGIGNAGMAQRGFGGCTNYATAVRRLSRRASSTAPLARLCRSCKGCVGFDGLHGCVGRTVGFLVWLPAVCRRRGQTHLTSGSSGGVR